MIILKIIGITLLAWTVFSFLAACWWHLQDHGYDGSGFGRE